MIKVEKKACKRRKLTTNPAVEAVSEEILSIFSKISSEVVSEAVLEVVLDKKNKDKGLL
jgi:hypothetical protein